MTPEEKRLMYRAVDKWGRALQLLMAIEEMAELAKLIVKEFRHGSSPLLRANLVQEIADVEIMLDQLKVVFNCEYEVVEGRKEKLKRLEERLNADRDIDTRGTETPGKGEI